MEKEEDRQRNEEKEREERRKARDRRNQVRLAAISNLDTTLAMSLMDGQMITVSDTEDDVPEAAAIQTIEEPFFDDLSDIKKEKISSDFEFDTDEEEEEEESDSDKIQYAKKKLEEEIFGSLSDDDKKEKDHDSVNDSSIIVEKNLEKMFGPILSEEANNTSGTFENPPTSCVNLLKNDENSQQKSTLENTESSCLKSVTKNENTKPRPTQETTTQTCLKDVKKNESTLQTPSQSQKTVCVRKIGNTKRIFKTKLEPQVDLTSDIPIEKSILRLEETVEIDDDDGQDRVHEIVGTMHIAEYGTMSTTTTTTTTQTRQAIKVEKMEKDLEEGEVRSNEENHNDNSVMKIHPTVSLDNENDSEDYAHGLLESRPNIRTETTCTMVQSGLEIQDLVKELRDIKRLLRKNHHREKKRREKKKHSRQMEENLPLDHTHIDKSKILLTSIKKEPIYISDDEVVTSTSKDYPAFDQKPKVKVETNNISSLLNPDKILRNEEFMLPKINSTIPGCSSWSHEKKKHKRRSHKKVHCCRSRKRRRSSSSSSSSSTSSSSSSSSRRSRHYSSHRHSYNLSHRSKSPSKPKKSYLSPERSRRRSRSNSSSASHHSNSSSRRSSRYSPQRSTHVLALRSRSRSFSPQPKKLHSSSRKYKTSPSHRAYSRSRSPQPRKPHLSPEHYKSSHRARSRSSSRESNRRRRSPRPSNNQTSSFHRQVSVSRQMCDNQGIVQHQKKTITQNHVVFGDKIISQEVTTTTNSFKKELQSFKQAVSKKFVDGDDGDSIGSLDIKVHTLNGRDVTRRRPNGDINHPFYVLPEDRELYGLRLKDGCLFVQAVHELCSKNNWYLTYFESRIGGQFCYAMKLQDHRITTTKKAPQKKVAKNELAKVFLQWLRIAES